MKLYAYRRAGRIEFETCQLPPEAHGTDIGTIEVEEPNAPKTATLTLAGMDDLIRQVSKLSQLAQRFEDGIREFFDRNPFAPLKKTVTKEAEDRGPTGEGDRSGYIERFFIPANAKNIHCTYEVTE